MIKGELRCQLKALLLGVKRHLWISRKWKIMKVFFFFISRSRNLESTQVAVQRASGETTSLQPASYSTLQAKAQSPGHHDICNKVSLTPYHDCQSQNNQAGYKKPRPILGEHLPNKMAAESAPSLLHTAGTF
ncbi:hypothetical protein RRG08_044067 [Elysia crispata]|uniref:Uncharacterized protein n=1 Tax=Elysia crispata TaxID=231223 RepID=A0AAE0Y1H0_9GAST|nr:hypothetical protein RRG08_044067 [Elysia crispata]